MTTQSASTKPYSDQGEALERLYHEIEKMPMHNRGGALVRWKINAQGMIIAALKGKTGV